MLVLLVILGAGLLVVAALITKMIVLAYVALGLCVLCLAVIGRAVSRDLRARKAGTVDGAGAVATDEPEDKDETTEPEGTEEEAADPEATVDETPGEPEPEPEPVAMVDAADDSVVCVIPGRMRYHHCGCASLDGRDYERVTVDEAREEGFSQCTSCAEPVPAVSASYREGLR
ncbi:MAG TPA: hypothetical protein VG674_13805 [Amycolatopsis sp.]|nr:hypothetical protein [Amycolatopsis sp.]